MQTFLPYPCFYQSLRTLHTSHMWKQVLEASQIRKSIEDPNHGWRNHPAVQMWIGYPGALAKYYNTALREFKARGGNTDWDIDRCWNESVVEMPRWLGDPVFHTRMQERMVEKIPEHYGEHFPYVNAVSQEVGYWWPVNDPDHPRGYYLRLKKGQTFVPNYRV